MACHRRALRVLTRPHLAANGLLPSRRMLTTGAFTLRQPPHRPHAGATGAPAQLVRQQEQQGVRRRHESFGGFAPGAAKLLHKLGSQHGAKLGHDELTAPWCARSSRSFHSMCISVALHRAAADEIIDAANLDTAADYGTAAH